ncbi:MAG: hypothetical protein U1F41_00205 [Burkholderiales bacterium]
MLVALTEAQAPLVVGAMRRVATADGREPMQDADRVAIDAFQALVLRRAPVPASAWPEVSGEMLVRAIPDPATRDHVVQFLIVMALVDGTIDRAKIAIVDAYAGALGVREDAVRQLAETGRGHLAWVRADVARRNLRSITGHDVKESIDAWILPYREREDPALAQRYCALGALPEGTLGRTFFEFYQDNGFPFAGEAAGLNQRFASPHDTTHILSGYDTSPQGELLVSTFTAGMHPKEPMSGHILPVILSWHVGIELAKLPGSVTGQLDPPKFWNAWDRGARTTVDVFDDTWNFWDAAREPLDTLRARYGIPPLDPRYAAQGDVPSWYRPVA